MGWRRGQAYNQHLRERVFVAFDAGAPVGAVARMLQVSISYVSKVLGRRRRSGETTARPQRCHVPARLTAYHACLRERVRACPDATLAELQTWLKETHQVSASVTLIWETLAELKLTRKKRPCTRRNRPAPTLPRRVRSGVRSAWR
jgi:transposase